MALVGPITITGSTGNSNWAFKTVVTEIAIDTVKKTSTVKVENFLGRTNSTSYFMGTYTSRFEAAGQVHSETVYKNSGEIAAGKYVSLGSHTFTITQTTTPLTITVKGSYSTSAFTPSSASSTGNVTLSKLHEAPVLGDVTWEETSSILSTTGIGADYFVPHLSIKKATVEPVLYDNATLTETRIINESKVYKSASATPNVVTMDLTNNTLYTTYDQVSKKTIPKISFGFTDNTGATSEWTYPYTHLIPYTKPNLITTSSSIKRNGQISGKVNLNLTGTFYNDKIGSKNNSITLSYKYWKQGTTEPGTYYTIPASAYTISGNSISMNNWNVAKSGTVISDVDKNSVYKFKIKAVDAFGSSQEIELTCPKGEWLMAKFKDRVDFKKITQNNQPLLPASLINVSVPEYSMTTEPWTNYQLTLNSNILLGNDFNLSNDTIVITGDNVEYISISVLLKYMIGSASSNRAIRIVLNDVQITSDYYIYTANATDWGTDTICNMIVPAKKGDVLKFYIVRGGSSNATTRIGSGYATISVVKYK